MTVLDITPLLALPDEEFIVEAWRSFVPTGADGSAGSEVPLPIVLGVHACESRTLVLVRAWIAAIAIDPRLRTLRLAGPGTRAANLAVRLPGGLPLLRLGLQALGNLTGRRTDRLAMKSRELALRLAQTERRLEQLELNARHLQAGIDLLGRELDQAVAEHLDSGVMADDLTRRVDLMAFEMRQAVDAAVLTAQERQSLAEAAQAAARHLRP